MHTQAVSVAEVQPCDLAVAIRHEDAQAETPAMDVSSAGAEEVVVAGVSVVDTRGAAVVVSTGAAEVADSAGAAVEVAPALVVAEHMDDWRARTAVMSALPQVTMQGVTAFWKAVVHTQAVSVDDEQPWDLPVAIRQAEAHAETPAIEVSSAGAEEVVLASTGVPVVGAASVVVGAAAVVDSTGAAVEVAPPALVVAEQVADWRARTGAMSEAPHATMQGVTAFWKVVVQTQATSVEEVQP